MLTELRIRNFAIIESLTLPLSGGFNVLSGETGAGKSIIVGALGFLLGERGSSDLIRTGADKATVEGVFDIGDRRTIAELIDERGIEADDGTVVLKREIAANGRGRAWANGSPVTATVLGEIGRALVNLHGQHEAQTLLDSDSQRAILDEFGSAVTQAHDVADSYSTLASIRREIAQLKSRRSDAERRADYLRHVVREIEDAKLTPGEDTRLEDEARVLENADELRSLAEAVSALLSGEEEGILERLASVNRSLAAVQRVDPAGARLQELFDSGFYALDELARAVDDYAASVDLDPERLEVVRRRREVIYSLVKKYGPGLDDVIEMGRKSRAELDLVDSGSFDLAQLEAREREAAEKLDAAAKRLSALRATAAKKLSKAVDAVLPDLGMNGGQFTVVLARKESIDENGAEDIVFRIALNVGHDARPLARVASGGELSRVMLALKTILARADAVPTLVFDEVDAGIGGKVGLQVGDTLRRVAEHHQVFAISHLPQIAARAHNHIVVAKAAKGGVTTADVTVLEGSTRIVEIARMLGGDPESKVSRAHARELLESAAGA
ncbi:MAG TPA: DNA repair protein RecN [Gemmatimonadaceae bacterium]|nr:DNA repair protein RecN [Gemmatimonadaceae bacterium]